MWKAILDHGFTAAPPNKIKSDGVEEIIVAKNVNELQALATSHPSYSNLNTYQQKKTIAQGMFDVALLTANANQLRYVLDSQGKIPYRKLNLTLITISLLLQILVGIMLICNGFCDTKKNLFLANRINNLTVCGIFIITITNAFISVFAVEN